MKDIWRVYVEDYSWSGHGEGGQLSRIVVCSPNANAHQTTPAERATMQKVAARLEQFIKSGGLHDL